MPRDRSPCRFLYHGPLCHPLGLAEGKSQQFRGWDAGKNETSCGLSSEDGLQPVSAAR